MYEVEALNLAVQAPDLKRYTGEAHDIDIEKWSLNQRVAVADKFIKNKRALKALQDYARARIAKVGQ